MVSRLATVLILFFGVSLPGFLYFQNPVVTDAYTQEWDLIERLSAGMWFMASVWCAASAIHGCSHTKEWLSGSIFFFLLGFRELDGHIWLFGWNLDKLALYWNPSIPILERLLIVCLSGVLISWLYTIFPPRRWKTLWAAYQAGEQWTRDVLLWLLVIVTTMLIDKSVYLPFYRHTPYPFIDVLRGILEESLELTLGIYTLILLFPLWTHALLLSHSPIAGKSS
ncbi:MAG: hypothetical protein NPIRA02_36000 [Nitrospirales bacterium]|nr:MAG: hypothetical protein NPIRA02_36000 [Nitrospirales bacterium]